MVVPPIGSPEHQFRLRELFKALIKYCGDIQIRARWPELRIST
jgi:hypothetical protein